MTNWSRSAVLVLGFAVLAPASAAAPEIADPTDRNRGPRSAVFPKGDHRRLVPAADRLLVPASEAASAATALRASGAQLGRRVPGTRFQVIRTAPGGARRAIAALRARDGIAGVQPDHRRMALEEPDDALFAKGVTPFMRTLRLPQAWDRSHADGQVVAVVDSGVDLDHPDLVGRLLPGRDFVDGDNVPADRAGHGTLMAGIVAAATDNERGAAGVAWGARILPVRVLDEDGLGFDSDIAAGIVWAADNGADVIELSLGGLDPAPVLDDAIAHATAAGAVVVAAAGNFGLRRPVYPAASAQALAVAGTDAGGDTLTFSSYGPWVDLAAPGWRIRSTALADGPRDAYGNVTGSSPAAAVASGVAALVRAHEPTLTSAQVAERLTSTATDVGPDGIDPHAGHGFIDPLAALGGPARPLQALPAADANGTPANATPIEIWSEPNPIGVGSRTALDSISQQGDEDWMRFGVTTPGEYLIDVRPNFNPGGLPADLDLAYELYGPDGGLVHRANGGSTGDAESEFVGLAEPGTYKLRVHNFWGSRSPPGFSPSRRSYMVNVQAGWYPRYDSFFILPSLTDGRFTVDGVMGGAAVADVTGDGRPDALATVSLDFPDDRPTADAPRLLVYPQTPEGWLDTPIPYEVGAQRWVAHVAAGDLDGDGDDDAVVAHDGGLAVLRQAGGRLGAPQQLSGTAETDKLEIADWNRDGRPDVIGSGPDGVFAELADDGGTFTRTAISPEPFVFDTDAGDLDGDGGVELAGGIWPGGRSAVMVLHRRSDGAVETTTFPGEVSALEIGDVTGDGREDLVHSTGYGSHQSALQVQRQTPLGTLGPVEGYDVVAPAALEIADFDGDGRDDVLGTRNGGDGTALLLQTATGDLAAPLTLSAQGGASDSLAAGDITGDGVMDAVSTHGSDGLLPLRRHSQSWPAPVWVQEAGPADRARGVATTAAPSVRFGRQLDPASITAATVRLEDVSTGAPVSAAREYDAGARTLTVRPASPLAAGHSYVLTVDGVRDAEGRTQGRGDRARTQGGVLYLTDNPLDDPFTLRFTVGPRADTTPPETLIVSAPTGVVRWGSVADEGFVQQASSEQLGDYECNRDGLSWYGCEPAFVDLPGQSESGPHSLRIRAIDAAGNADPTPEVIRWITDRDPAWPENADVFHPQQIAGASGEAEVTTISVIHFASSLLGPLTAANEGGSAVWYEWTAPADGEVVFDTSGSAFDTVMAVVKDHPASNFRPLAVVAEDDDGGDGRAARAAFEAVGGQTYWIGVGGWTDGYGDGAGFPAAGAMKLAWSQGGVVTPEPRTSIDSGPDGPTAGRNAAFAFSSPDAGATFECRVDDDGWEPCATPLELTGLDEGEHVLDVRARLGARVDLTPAHRAWTVDATPPTAEISEGPPLFTTATSVEFRLIADEPASFECRLDEHDWSPCTSPWTLAGLSPRQHTLFARAIDVAGNVGAPEQWTWSQGPVDPGPAGEGDSPDTAPGGGTGTTQGSGTAPGGTGTVPGSGTAPGGDATAGDDASAAELRLALTRRLRQLTRQPLRIRRGRVRVGLIACPDRMDPRFSRLVLCRFAAKARLRLSRSSGAPLGRATRTLSPGHTIHATVRLRRGRTPRRAVARLTLLARDGSVTTVSWKVRLR